MRQFFKRLLLPFAVAAVTQTSIVSAESIRLIGPGGEVQSAPQFSSDIVGNRSGSEPSRVVGPTSDSDTLWSIATRLRPSNQVSVQQTLLAIYRLNPRAFENQNIHSLIPGSTLRVPSLAQVQASSTQEAVAIMAAHQARLDQQTTVANNTTENPAPADNPVETTPATEDSVQESVTEPAAETPVVPATASQQAAGGSDAENEIQALEEKNHRLRLMLAEVQTEVSGLKQELGDENRIRSEVEKLLAEERMKREEVQRLAPSQLDQLLSNNWVVAGLALIPGLFIALLVMLFLGRRSGSNQDATQTTQTPLNTTPDSPAAPVIAGEQSLDELDEELLLDDDLFGDMEDSDSLFGEEKPEQEESESASDTQDDVFGGLDDDDLDFDLEGEDGEDLFAAIDDSGDLDTEFSELSSSNSGISVSGEEKALSLEEMERALDQASEADDEDGGFDLSDDGEMSQEDIESLLASDGDSEELESSSLDQSMLDDLFAQQSGEDDDTEDLLNFDSLLADEGTDTAEKTQSSAEDENPTSFTSDEDLDNLFANIEAQADLEALEANAQDESVLDQPDDDESLFDSENTALLDDLLDEDSSDEDLSATDDVFMSELDDLLGETDESDIPEDSTDLLDDFIGELSEEPEGYDSFLSDADSEDTEEKDESLELFDELLDIEKSSSEEEPDFNSENFIDDLINNAPERDPLLDEDEFDLDSLAPEVEAEPDDFDFNPEIEGSDNQEDQSAEDVDVVANEFGVPQDEDWALDDEEPETVTEDEVPVAQVQPDADTADLAETQSESEPAEPAEYSAEDALADLEADLAEDLEEQPESEPAASDIDDILADFDDAELPESTEEDALADSNSEVAQETVEPESAEPEASDIDDILADFDDAELPESTEEDALADSNSEVAQETVEPESAESDASDIDDILAEFDDSGLPEFTEEDALADSDSEAAEETAEPESAEPDASDIDDILAEFDDSELPEFTEEDALADSDSEAAEETAEPESAEPDASDIDDILAEFDDSELPEFTEEDALADSEPDAAEETAEPEAAEPDASDIDDILAEFDDAELPEFTEEDALADSEPEVAEETAEPETEEPDASDIDDILAEFDDAELPEFTEEDALADSEPEVAEETAEPESAEPDASDIDDILAEFDDAELPEFTEEDALADSEPENSESDQEEVLQDDAGQPEQNASEPKMDSSPTEKTDSTEVNLSDMAKQEFDEQALSDWLSDDESQQPRFSFDQPMDAKSVDSAGMDIDAMLEVGGEDWNGFNLTPDQQASITDDVPEAERDAWQPDIQVDEPEVEAENWENQDEFDELDSSAGKYMTIDELMAQTEQEDGESLNLDEEELKLDVGLNEFPDVIGDISDFDVDNNAEAASKLDLAKIYIEMNDDKGAVKLLEEAIVDGSDDIRQQAKHLIDVINGRA